jgi:hypothetical protein
VHMTQVTLKVTAEISEENEKVLKEL